MVCGGKCTGSVWVAVAVWEGQRGVWVVGWVVVWGRPWGSCCGVVARCVGRNVCGAVFMGRGVRGGRGWGTGAGKGWGCVVGQVGKVGMSCAKREQTGSRRELTKRKRVVRVNRVTVNA